MSSLESKVYVKKLIEQNIKLSKELSITRERLKILIELKIIFDLYSNKIKQSLESNEWQKFDRVLNKINEFVTTKITSNGNVIFNVNTGHTQQRQPQEVSQLSIGAIIVLKMILYNISIIVY